MDDRAPTYVSGPPAPSNRAKPGEVLAERFEIAERLARDQWVSDYRAIDQESETQVLVRVVEGALLEGADVSKLAEKLAAATGIGGHYVPGLLAVERDGDRLFVVEPLPTGVPLSEVLYARAARGGGLTPAETLPVVAQLAAALEAIPPPWSHGDVRIERVWLDPQHLQLTLPFVATVLPSGAVARAIGDDVRLATIIAPEALRGMCGPAADRFGVACIAFEALTGQMPAADRLRATKTPVAEVVARYLDPDPKKRPGTLRPILDAIANAAAMPVPALDAAPFRRARRPLAKRPLLTPHPNTIDTMPEDEQADLQESTNKQPALSEDDAARILAPVPSGPTEPWDDAAPTLPTTSLFEETRPHAEIPGSKTDVSPRPEGARSPAIETTVVNADQQLTEVDGDNDAPTAAAEAELDDDLDELLSEDTKPRPSRPRVRRREIEGASGEGTMEITMEETEVIEGRQIPGAAPGGTMEIDARELFDEPSDVDAEVAEAITDVVEPITDVVEPVTDVAEPKTEVAEPKTSPTEARTDVESPKKVEKRRHRESSDAIDPRLMRAALGVELDAESTPGEVPAAPKRPDITEEIGPEMIQEVEHRVAADSPMPRPRRMSPAELAPMVDEAPPRASAPQPVLPPAPVRPVSSIPAPRASVPPPAGTSPPVADPPMRKDPTPQFTPTGDYQDGALSDLGGGSYHTPGLVTSGATARRAVGRWILVAAAVLGVLIILGGVLIANKRRDDIERERRLHERWLELQQQQQSETEP